ncbi:MAG: hypothetical protein A4E19_20420 [Nitrospira sp. SG-bin1]|nr:MAG: hypothetical protein A4E19_20420 [Nitrospira sp. SG-bin1]
MGVAVFIASTVFFAATGSSAQASSHREAPLITEMPKVDGTDFYMFRSYEQGREAFVTIIANWLPLQDAYGGPNYFFLDPDALYEIHIDNTGDAKEDITFQFRFKNTLQNLSVPVGGKNVPVPLINIGPISAGSPQNLNIVETYTLDVVRGNRRSGHRQAVSSPGPNGFSKPTDNIGNKSIPGYAAFASSQIHNFTWPGCSGQSKIFVGQRKESFYVNLGEVFDLINLDPLGPPDAKPNILNDKNITSFILEVPISCLTRDENSPVIGAWMTSSLRQSRILRPEPTAEHRTVSGGAWTQVSRLGMPLVNEVVIGLPDKDKFNASKPENDAQFLTYVTNPSLPALIEALFPSAKAPTQFPRADLVAVFLTGVQNVNQIRSSPTPGEMLRLNTSIPATPAASQNVLGAALCFVNGMLTLNNPGCDPAGFPNGRRPIDDVVDIELRVAMGYLLPSNVAAAGQLPFTDQTRIPASSFSEQFPYLATPIPGAPQGAAPQ